METKFEIKVYENPNKRFAIWAQPNRREYGESVDREADSIYVIRCTAFYAFETDDICAMIYWLIQNKQLRRAQEAEIRKIMESIRKSLTKSGNYNLPIANIQVCKFGNCAPCPYFKNEHCTSEGGTMMQIYLEKDNGS